MRIFTMALLLSVMGYSAAHAQVSLGLKVAYVNSGLNTDQPVSTGASADPLRRDGWMAGMFLNIPLGHQMYLQPGISFITKGANFKRVTTKPANVYSSGVTKLNLHYIELPVYFVYKIPVSFGKFALGAGPYAAYGAGGKYRLDISYGNNVVQSSSHAVSFRNNAGIISSKVELNRWDAGANFMAALEMNNYLTIHGNYSIGMVDVDKAQNNSIRNHYFSVGLGVLLNREDW